MNPLGLLSGRRRIESPSRLSGAPHAAAVSTRWLRIQSSRSERL